MTPRTADPIAPAALTKRHAPLWTGADHPADGYVYTLDNADAEEVADATAVACRRFAGRDMTFDRDLHPLDFPLPRLSGPLHNVVTAVAAGRGFAVLRGLPVDYLSESECAVLLRGLSAHLGAIATQSRDGHLIRHVRATGRSLGDALTRGHQTAQRLWFHTDGADAAVLLCRRAAASGGLSRLASAATVHNGMLATDSEAVAALYRRFHFHMAGGNVPDLPPTFVSRVFALNQDRFSCRYVRHTLLETPAVTGVALSRRALAAFDLLEETADRVSLDMELCPGDLQVVNNHTVLHSRTSYDDPAEPEQARHLLRAWITLDGYGGRRPGLVDEGLRHGWLTDDLQHQIAQSWRPPAMPDDPADR